MASSEHDLTSSDTPEVRGQRRFGVSRQLRALSHLRPRQIGQVLSRAYADWSADGAARLGAALAYFTSNLSDKSGASLAYAVRFDSPERTLTDVEVAEARQALIDAVTTAHGATLRG